MSKNKYRVTLMLQNENLEDVKYLLKEQNGLIKISSLWIKRYIKLMGFILCLCLISYLVITILLIR